MSGGLCLAAPMWPLARARCRSVRHGCRSGPACGHAGIEAGAADRMLPANLGCSDETSLAIRLIACKRNIRQFRIRSARIRRQPGAAGRQHHRVHRVSNSRWAETAGAAQAERTRRDACGHHTRPNLTVGTPNSLQSRLCAVARRRDQSDRRPRRGRNRPCHYAPSRAARMAACIVTASPASATASRFDHQARGPGQTARGLLSATLCHRRRPDLLRA